MGLFDGFKTDMLWRKAYMAHVQANRLYDQDKGEEARAKHEEALSLYAKAMEKGGGSAEQRMAYGVLLLRFGQFDLAREIFLKCEKMPGLDKQTKHKLRVDFAICQWKRGELDSAIQQLKLALQEAKTGQIYGSLGYVLIEKARQTGDFEEALAFNKEALDYDDEDAVVLDNMGQLYLAMGDKDKALDYFTKAHEQRPKQVDTLYYLARLSAERGDKKTALGYLDTAIDGNYSALCTTTRDMAKALKAELEA